MSHKVRTSSTSGKAKTTRRFSGLECYNNRCSYVKQRRKEWIKYHFTKFIRNNLRRNVDRIIMSYNNLLDIKLQQNKTLIDELWVLSPIFYSTVMVGRDLFMVWTDKMVRETKITISCDYCIKINQSLSFHKHTLHFTSEHRKCDF